MNGVRGLVASFWRRLVNFSNGLFSHASSVCAAEKVVGKPTAYAVEHTQPRVLAEHHVTSMMTTFENAFAKQKPCR
jgi:hypothetical protein